MRRVTTAVGRRWLGLGAASMALGAALTACGSSSPRVVDLDASCANVGVDADLRTLVQRGGAVVLATVDAVVGTRRVDRGGAGRPTVYTGFRLRDVQVVAGRWDQTTVWMQGGVDGALEIRSEELSRPGVGARVVLPVLQIPGVGTTASPEMALVDGKVVLDPQTCHLPGRLAGSQQQVTVSRLDGMATRARTVSSAYLVPLATFEAAVRG